MQKCGVYIYIYLRIRASYVAVLDCLQCSRTEDYPVVTIADQWTSFRNWCKFIKGKRACNKWLLKCIDLLHSGWTSVSDGDGNTITTAHKLCLNEKIELLNRNLSLTYGKCCNSVYENLDPIYSLIPIIFKWYAPIEEWTGCLEL